MSRRPPTSLIDPKATPLAEAPTGSRNGGRADTGIPGSRSVPGAARPGRSLPGPLRTVWRIGMVLFGLQFLGLVAWSWYLWSRFDVGNDFAAFGQAFARIGTGHLNPYETSFWYHYPHWGYPFYQSAFELFMWPLALLYTVTRSMFTLLVVQDLALAGAGLAALRWGVDYLAVHWPGHRRGAAAVGAGLIVLLLVNPWTYWSASFDFHFETVAAVFAVLAARDAWLGRNRAWVWLALLLSCGDVAATYGVAVGLLLLLGGARTRRIGASFAAVSVGWLVLIGLVHGVRGSGIQAYGYLAGHPVSDGLGGMAAIVFGGLTHPGRALSVLDGRWHALSQYLRGAGLLGIASVIGLVPVVVVLGTNALNASPVWSGPFAVFQNVVIVFFMGVGGVAVLTWIVRRNWRYAPVLAGVVGVLAIAQACVLSKQVMPGARNLYATVSAPTAAELARVQQKLQPGAEAVVSWQLDGPFADRRDLYPFGYAFPQGQIFPVTGGRPVYFVLERRPDTASMVDAAARRLEGMGARVLADRDGVVALVWTPPPGVASVRLGP